MATTTKRKIRVNPPKSNKIKCIGDCGKEKAPSNVNFFKEIAEGENKDTLGYFPICKECLKKMVVNDYGFIIKDQFLALLRSMDLVYVPAVYEQALEKHRENQFKVLGEYRGIILNNPEYKTKVYADSVLYSNATVQPTGYCEDRIEVDEKLIAFWGIVEDPSLYEVYQSNFEDLVYEDGGQISSVKEGYFKNLAILKHTAQQQLLAKQYKDYKTTVDTIALICEKCGINPKQVQEKEDANRGTFGVFIKMIEEEEPIFDPDKDLGKIDVVKRVLEVFFFGHLAEVLKLKNPLKVRYDETMDDYTVKIESYEDILNLEETEEQESLRKIKSIRSDLGKKLRAMRMRNTRE